MVKSQNTPPMAQWILEEREQGLRCCMCFRRITDPPQGPHPADYVWMVSCEDCEDFKNELQQELISANIQDHFPTQEDLMRACDVIYLSYGQYRDVLRQFWKLCPDRRGDYIAQINYVPLVIWPAYMLPAAYKDALGLGIKPYLPKDTGAECGDERGCYERST